MAAVIERAKPPAGIKNDCARRQGESWNADENKNNDCGQNSRTFGALINEASIHEAQIDDHRTPEAAQSQRLGKSEFACGRACTDRVVMRAELYSQSAASRSRNPAEYGSSLMLESSLQ